MNKNEIILGLLVAVVVVALGMHLAFAPSRAMKRAVESLDRELPVTISDEVRFDAIASRNGMVNLKMTLLNVHERPADMGLFRRHLRAQIERDYCHSEGLGVIRRQGWPIHATYHLADGNFLTEAYVELEHCFRR